MSGIRAESAGLERVREELESMAELERPVVRGKWIKLDMRKGLEQYKCSVCRSEGYVPECMGEPMYDYCPNCGADMREHDGEEAKRIKKQLALNGLGYPYDLPNREV